MQWNLKLPTLLLSLIYNINGQVQFWRWNGCWIGLWPELWVRWWRLGYQDDIEQEIHEEIKEYKSGLVDLLTNIPIKEEVESFHFVELEKYNLILITKLIN